MAQHQSLALLSCLILLLAAGCDKDPDTEGQGATPANPPVEAPTMEAENPNADPHAGLPNRPTARPSAPTGPARAGGLTWSAPEPFDRQAPSNSMRKAEYLFPEQEGEEAATLTVFFFGQGQGGNVQDNVDRWIGQFTQTDGSASAEAAETTEMQVNELAASIVDVSGTFTGGGMMPGAAQAAQPNQRMLAAIVEGPQGPVFFKMVGQASLMERADSPFRALVQSVRPE